MTRLLIVLGLATLGFTAAPPARACDEYCEEYVEHMEERAYERASVREEAMEDGEGQVYARQRGMQRRAMPSAPRVSASKRSSRTDDDEEDAEPKTSQTSSSKSEVATAGGCKQYSPAIGMTLTVPCK